ncbi:hypothetical protein GH714_005099 [Hevea brasiliensis]|uniref:Uncharacterized protein n=1 Tax=Hevea brasiliensis TaxID=3981 RepID=A0A6A6MA85_HEVBR|nr:hypothetical protein GH714_005099 [Hevea brasiliensis]
MSPHLPRSTPEKYLMLSMDCAFTQTPISPGKLTLKSQLQIVVLPKESAEMPASGRDQTVYEWKGSVDGDGNRQLTDILRKTRGAMECIGHHMVRRNSTVEKDSTDNESDALSSDQA